MLSASPGSIRWTAVWLNYRLRVWDSSRQANGLKKAYNGKSKRRSVKRDKLNRPANKGDVTSTGRARKKRRRHNKQRMTLSEQLVNKGVTATGQQVSTTREPLPDTYARTVWTSRSFNKCTDRNICPYHRVGKARWKTRRMHTPTGLIRV